MTDRAVPPQQQTQSGPPADIPFQFGLLGEMRITCEGGLLPLPPYRARSLLAALLLAPHAQRRDQLIGLLFPNLPESTGRRRLSDLLWLLRRWMPNLPLESTTQEILLPASSRWLDVEAFELGCASVDASRWLDALNLYRGDLLEGVYDDWLLERKEALYLEYVRLLHRTCDALLARRQFEQVLPLAERLLQAEPCDEKALHMLMQVYQSTGRRGAALAAYEQFVALVADEFDAEPGPATRALADAIRVARPARRAAPPPDLLVETEPERLLARGRDALLRGERDTVEDCIERLSALASEQARRGAWLLDIDLALFFEEHARAERLISSYSGRRAPILTRSAALALERHDTPAAHAAASEGLMLAHEEQDQQSEVEALLLLAQAQREGGQTVQAERSAERALQLARELSSSLATTQALLVIGHGQVLQGRYSQALSLFQEARFLAHEHHLRRHLGEALRGISLVQCHGSAMLKALNTQQEELSIWRDLGLRSREATTLHSLATIYDYLGRTADSLRALEQAREICAELGEPIRLAINQYHLAGNSLYHSDALAPRAIHLTRQALATFQAHNQSGWEATVLRWLGYALWVDERHADALATYQQAYALHERLGELGVLPELLAYQGLAHIGLGEYEKASELTRRALWTLAQGQVSDEVVPEIYYAHAMALDARGEAEQAGIYFRRAYQKLLDAARQLDSEEARQAFFQHNPTTRRLMGEIYRRDIAPSPESGLVTRRLPSARGEGLVRVTWTLDAGPPDVVLKQAQGAIALRRRRLSRLLDEADTQGAAPTIAHLAETLGVSVRTIQRDLATLRNPEAASPDLP